ncbi:hypothetical protein VOLCADRAFT_98382 [Volvox carteri f. nagariensis]|uniref:Uncharacterized protein n=1 Tax=Volvox carteri f. nagariensis TaxID=3068 RepID=D8UF72_VOLCA|nr:uncharacterized protein VOLCADRAFT_98382 [Volvox carteri f. nagariensis]EFJ41631.1 hypothetical protein VOLCADRAFT_98382 [Volvox carteri f. nagariensis]|eukprot:XP_002957287.1 hypothetical protein VOLCADRAFT_98382 [Volvox carteri f. nagariensis]
MKVAVWALTIFSFGVFLASGTSELWEDAFVGCAMDAVRHTANCKVPSSDVTIQGVTSKCLLRGHAIQAGLGNNNTSLRIAALNVSSLLPLVKSVNRIAAANGLAPVSWTLLDPATADVFLKQEIKHERSFHAYVLSGQQAGDMIYLGVPQDLSGLVARDHILDWTSLLPFYREFAAVFGGVVTSIPVSGFVTLLYYRTDLFEAAGRQPPRTWQEALETAAHFNGSDLDGDGQANDYGICLWQSRDCVSAGLPVLAILASLVQSGGHSSGLFMQPSTGKAVVDTAAWLAALQLAEQLGAFAPPAADRRAAGSRDCTYMPLFGQVAGTGCCRGGARASVRVQEYTKDQSIIPRVFNFLRWKFYLN